MQTQQQMLRTWFHGLLGNPYIAKLVLLIHSVSEGCSGSYAAIYISCFTICTYIEYYIACMCIKYITLLHPDVVSSVYTVILFETNETKAIHY